ncbi:MAG: cysteine synthase family protein [Lachnospiraceae bacterium]|nr:cysteine synthase family protein [Lachnospiraceae bacterium]
MSRTYNSLIDLVGNTPLVELKGFEKNNSLKANIYGKLEYFNPTGSVKDRIAARMILDAENEGLIHPGDTIIDNTSGNTGISLAALGVPRGYKVVIAIEAGVSPERHQIMRAYGAELHELVDIPGLAEAASAPDATFQSLLAPMAKYASENGYYYINQCDNASNIKAHYEGTAPEIYEALDGKVDIFITMSGTGGTLHGVGRYLKEKNPDVQIILAQPDAASLPAPGKTEPQIDGIMMVSGVPEGLAPIFYKKYGFNFDEVITVTGAQAYEVGREVAKSDGVFIGESSAAALTVAKIVASRPENSGKNIVVMMADGGAKYLSSGMFKQVQE